MSPSIELFEIFDRSGKSIGTAPRNEVHRQGLIHRSVHVLLTNGRGQGDELEILVQRRASTKDVCPNRWDLSVGEHLRPAESYADGAARGLFEELGITQGACPLRRIRAEHLQDNTYDDIGVHDVELVETWAGRWDGAITADGVEVVEVQWRSLASLAQHLGKQPLGKRPESLTPWFCEELQFVLQQSGVLVSTSPLG